MSIYYIIIYYNDITYTIYIKDSSSCVEDKTSIHASMRQ